LVKKLAFFMICGCSSSVLAEIKQGYSIKKPGIHNTRIKTRHKERPGGCKHHTEPFRGLIEVLVILESIPRSVNERKKLL
jgi:hypothetical protein